MICESCGKETNGKYGIGRFCNHACQAKYAWKLAGKKANENKIKKAKEKKEAQLNTECICERCNKHYLLKDGVSIRFCSRSCANTRQHSSNTKAKISKSLKRLPPLPDKFCKDCHCLLCRTNKSGYCNKCINKYKNNNVELREKQRKIQLEKVKNGTHKGWITRNITSFAERFFETVLNNNKIKFIREKKVGKYFLDFVIGDIDLEIDGKQHKYKDRKESDIIRDDFLRKQGYFVYRIAWNEINSVCGKQMMKDKIELFLDFYEFITQRW